MVPAALPITKIAALVIKTLAKPVSNRIKKEFSKHTTTSVGLIQLGQLSNNITSRLTIWSAGYKVRSVQPLSTADALRVGSELLGETMVFTVSITAVVWEYNRSKEKEKIKEQALHTIATNERQLLQSTLQQLDNRLHTLEIIVQKNYTTIQQLQQLQQKPQQQEPDNINNTTTVSTTQQQQQQQQRKRWIFF